jgi:hypothetical protein
MNERPEVGALLAALRYDYDAVRHELGLLDDIELAVLRGASLDLQLDITVLQQERARRGEGCVERPKTNGEFGAVRTAISAESEHPERVKANSDFG